MPASLSRGRRRPVNRRRCDNGSTGSWYWSTALGCCRRERCIPIALPVTVEIRPAGAADQPAQNWQGVGEKRSAGLQLIIAALLVVVAERRKDRGGRKRLLELLPEELHRLTHKDAIGGIRMVLRRGIEFPAEAVCEKITGYQHEGRLRQCLRHVPQLRADQH